MAQKIHNYSIDRTTLGDDDFFDVDYWDGSVYKTAKMKGSVIKASASGLIGLYSMTRQSNPIVSTGIETSLFDGAVAQGTLQVPANGFSAGSSYHCKISGEISNINNTDINIRVKSNGSVILADTGTITLPAMTSKIFEIELDFTIRQVGTLGVAEIITMGEIIYVQNSGTQFEGMTFSSVNNSTFDTTIDNELDICWEWATASSQNSVQTLMTNLRKTF